ncbi:MAG: hypothetical protein HXY34_03090 [Candidatus Thorarchaeota archaeon]|nr:hypothetical protein [Candidatus Thorarchaeota archaeon]
MSAGRKKVLFDQTQNDRGRIDSTYSQLAQVLRDNDFDVEPYTDFMILPKTLAGSDVFVLACPNSSKLRPAEMDALRKYVLDGGGLMLLSLSGGDRGLMNNMSQLSKTFGIEFENTAVKDERNNDGMPTMPIITNIVGHVVTENISELLVPAACTLRVSGGAMTIASTSSQAEPPAAPIIAIAEHGKGRVMCIGSYEVFRRGGGLKKDDNRVFAVNAFRWLAAITRSVKPSEVAAAQEGKTTPGTVAAVEQRTTVPADIDFTLKRLVNAVFDLQKDIEKLTKKIESSGERIEALRSQFQEFAEKTQQQLGLMVPAKQFRTEEEDRVAALSAEIQGLEKEISSVQQLRDHVEKKRASGTMSQETYEEQIKKLDEKMASLTKTIEKKKAERAKSQTLA